MLAPSSRHGHGGPCPLSWSTCPHPRGPPHPSYKPADPPSSVLGFRSCSSSSRRN
ncbi:hypothetical protein BCR44DRAFT_1445061, partial [Catenaria anguillulae PL171]